MDTKTLYNWANEADLNFAYDDGEHDAIQVWIDAWMHSPDLLMDYFTDWMFDDMDRVKSMLRHMGEGYSKIRESQSTRNGEKLQSTLAISASTQLGFVGADLMGMCIDQMTDYVEQNAYEWWIDCCSYHSDMEAGQKEDYLFEQAKDRKMEEMS